MVKFNVKNEASFITVDDGVKSKLALAKQGLDKIGGMSTREIGVSTSQVRQWRDIVTDLDLELDDHSRRSRNVNNKVVDNFVKIFDKLMVAVEKSRGWYFDHQSNEFRKRAIESHQSGRVRFNVALKTTDEAVAMNNLSQERVDAWIEGIIKRAGASVIDKKFFSKIKMTGRLLSNKVVLFTSFKGSKGEFSSWAIQKNGDKLMSSADKYELIPIIATNAKEMFREINLELMAKNMGSYKFTISADLKDTARQIIAEEPRQSTDPRSAKVDALLRPMATRWCSTVRGGKYKVSPDQLLEIMTKIVEQIPESVISDYLQWDSSVIKEPPRYVISMWDQIDKIANPIIGRDVRDDLEKIVDKMIIKFMTNSQGKVSK